MYVDFNPLWGIKLPQILQKSYKDLLFLFFTFWDPNRDEWVSTLVWIFLHKLSQIYTTNDEIHETFRLDQVM